MPYYIGSQASLLTELHFKDGSSIRFYSDDLSGSTEVQVRGLESCQSPIVYDLSQCNDPSRSSEEHGCGIDFTTPLVTHMKEHPYRPASIDLIRSIIAQIP